MNKNTKKPTVIAVASQKGGVAKTTTAINVAVALSLKGYKVLLIDFDPQESLSNFFGVYGLDTENNVGNLMYKTINDEPYDLTDYIIHNEINDVDIISSENERMKKLDKTDLNSIEGGELVLKRVLDNNYTALKVYDFVFIDCSASLDFLTDNALTASDYVLVPCQASPIVFAALPNLYAEVDEVRNKTNSSLSVLGVVATLCENTNISRQTIEMLGQTYDECFNTHISRQTVVGESAIKEKAVVLSQAKDNKAAQQYRTLADEILERL